MTNLNIIAIIAISLAIAFLVTLPFQKDFLERLKASNPFNEKVLPASARYEKKNTLVVASSIFRGFIAVFVIVFFILHAIFSK